MSKKEQIKKVKDWFVTTTPAVLSRRDIIDENNYDYGVVVTKMMLANEMLAFNHDRDSKGKKYICCRVIGKVDNIWTKIGGRFYVEDGILIPSESEKYQISEKDIHRDYAWFNVLAERNMPILYNYLISQSKDKFFVSGQLYENGEFTYICEEIIDQNLENFYVILKDGKTVFINWLSISFPLESNLRYKILHAKRDFMYSDITFLNRKCQLDIFNSKWDFDPIKDKKSFEVYELYEMEVDVL